MEYRRAINVNIIACFIASPNLRPAIIPAKPTINGIKLQYVRISYPAAETVLTV
jgi:hypothetical protein